MNLKIWIVRNLTYLVIKMLYFVKTLRSLF